jgi:hypothetical protein
MADAPRLRRDQVPGHLRHHLAKFIGLVTRATQNRRHQLVREKVVERCPGAEAFDAKALQILPPQSIHRVTEALERLMEEDAAADRPFIAALVISKARGGLPASGFFDCARRLGRFAGDPDGQDAWSFHAAELNAVFVRWGGSRDS